MEHKNMTEKEAVLYIKDIRNSYLNRKNHIHALTMAKAALEFIEALKWLINTDKIYIIKDDDYGKCFPQILGLDDVLQMYKQHKKSK